MDDELTGLLAAVDPVNLGRRIKQARVKLELTQGDLAAESVSVGYVSRIESGQRRPDLPVLEGMARRLGTTAHALLTGAPDPTEDRLRVALDLADLSLRGGTTEDARQRLESVADTADWAEFPFLERRWRYLQALAWEASGLLDDAIVTLEDLLAEPVEDLEAARCAIALSRCYRESGDLARAIDVGDASLARLRALDLGASDEAIQLSVTVAASHFLRGDVAHAVRLCRRAIDLAEGADAPAAMASAYWNASIMEHERGDSRSAVSLAERALQLLDSAESNRNVARLRAELGIFQLRLDPPEIAEARANFEAAAQQFEWSSASPVDKGRNVVSLARAKLMSGDAGEAYADAEAVLVELRSTSPLLAGEALILMGQSAFDGGKKAAATRHYREAAAILTGLGSDRAAADCWFELGSLLDEVGLKDEAHDAYRSAAASAGLNTWKGPQEKHREQTDLSFLGVAPALGAGATPFACWFS